MTIDRKQGPAGAQGQQQDVGTAEPANNASKQLQVQQMRMMRARKYNQGHAADAAEFQKLTGVDPMNIAAVKKWQGAHGVATDGKIGPATLRAAKPQAPGAEDAAFQVPDVTFSDEEGAEDAKAKPESPLGEAVEGGDGGLNKKHHETDLNEGDTIAAEGVGKISEDVIDDDMEEGLGKTVAGKVGSRLILIPRIVGLLRQHQYKEAANVLIASVGKEEYVEVAKLVVEKLRGEISGKLLQRFILAGALGAAFDSVMLGREWFELGMKAIDEAHERGDQDSQNSIYAWAYADMIMTGQHSNPGAITPEQIEAKNKGMEMGRAALEETPELPFLLKEEYGSGANARHAIEDALLAKVGIHVRTHS